MFKYLENVIKNVRGNVLTICVDSKIIDYFDKNNLVNLYSITSNTNKKSGFKKNKKMHTNKGKDINIKKLRKKLNKKSIDYMFVNFNDVINYYKYLIKDTVFLNCNTLYLYFDKNIDVDFIVKRYKRYNVPIKVTDYKNNYLVIIDNTNSKNNYFKDKIYFIRDTLYNIAEAIGNILVS